ncbi:hypothetical protein GYMLUDRAFT_448888 [Collybiopsis luxurians FD-317 M1]|uniref:Uncharacterized protein n=1 Tax=Collybiopsis luxurians FD-317 M1 TaxID=944289 RepID=A0A0D0BI46_9AGAR|nr:hypothetical protein GYMLUDRAFT_448888 [Collybiopsis luxurians FD-317 M1]
MSLITSTSVEDLACEAFGPESSSPSITDSTFSGSARRARRHGKIFTIPDFFETETNSPSFRISSSESDLRSWRSAEINLDDMNDSRRFPTTKVVSKLTPKQIRLSVSMESMLNVEDSVKLPMNLHEVKQWLRKNSNPGRQAGSVYSASRASQTLRWSGDLQSDDYLPPPPSNGIESLDDDFRLTIVLELPPVRSVEHLGALLDFYEDTKTDVTLGWKQGEILGLDLDSVQEIMEMLQSELDSVECFHLR